MAIHWCGTGLSAIPGLRQLIKNGHEVVVWNRTKEKAVNAIGDLAAHVEKFSKEAIKNALEEGDLWFLCCLVNGMFLWLNLQFQKSKFC